MTQTVRTFIAIELSDEVRSALLDLQNRLKATLPPKTVRWTAPPNIHLTLHFLGEVPVEQVEAIGQVVTITAQECPPFTLKLAGMGCFPNIRRPRILWAGVSGQTKPLLAMHKALGGRLKTVIDFEPDNRSYAPHLTIGRVKNGIPRRHLTQLGEALEEERLAVGELALLPVAGISLIKSELKPAGAVYTPLAHGECQGS
jgi:2'-5' RNA ligase